ncbi:hypothetical protein HNR02_002884 [Amycolatopsis endophytica]|uniref:Uncharacterized protein n=1 Tax=Amycolatopsis endophytica TaxID=860233 RepID=A0A853B483_9PSEU|nr:hypothetical protein [Amycolatopsis endophytica]
MSQTTGHTKVLATVGQVRARKGLKSSHAATVAAHGAT